MHPVRELHTNGFFIKGKDIASHADLSTLLSALFSNGVQAVKPSQNLQRRDQIKIILQFFFTRKGFYAKA